MDKINNIHLIPTEQPSEVEEISRCCGRCNGVDDLCYTDMCCDDHHIYGCEVCYGKRITYKIKSNV